MTNKIERKQLPEIPSDEVPTAKQSKSKGNFICLNTANIRGMRLNMDTLESYAPNTDTSINVARATGRIVVELVSKEERDALLARLDAYCL